MDTKENVHDGHRKRTIEKFLKYPDSFREHEILEMVLFYAIPRIDTNVIAHRLIKAFGSLNKVFSATADELKAVDGIGDKTAAFLSVIGKICKTEGRRQAEVVDLNTPEAVKSLVKDKLDFRRQESFLLILLDKKHRLISVLEFSDDHKEDVCMEIPEINQAILIHHPSFAIIAHNHPSGNPNPSGVDDLATKKIHLICSLSGVNLIDHIIYACGKFYSYHTDGRMEHVKSEADVNLLLNNIKERHYNGN